MFPPCPTAMAPPPAPAVHHRPPTHLLTLVLLVLADQVVHVGLCFGELHLVHALGWGRAGGSVDPADPSAGLPAAGSTGLGGC